MKLNRKLMTAALLLLQLLPQSAPAFVLLEPPATGFVMNLDLQPSEPFQTIGYGLTSWSKLAESALATWNSVGIGTGPDYGFFQVTNPVVAGSACTRDGVNQVTWASDNCGFSFGDVIAITNRWIDNGLRVEEDVIFNSNLPFNAYRGPLVSASGGRWLNDFFRVAVHEFGHVAGLEHPDQAGQKVAAIMNSYMGNIDSLQADDIAGAHAIAWSAVSVTQAPKVTASVNKGWNLVGNGSGATLDVPATFGNSSDVVTVWKWIATEAKWAFYSPTLAGQQLIDYAKSKGYAVLTSVNSGEAFWINAKYSFLAQWPAGTAVTAASYQTRLTAGWNLIAIGDSKTPREFDSALSQGYVPANLNTLWAWDAVKSKWYFYAPSLDAKAGTVLGDYIASKGYLDFGTKTLEPGMGFWVNKP